MASQAKYKIGFVLDDGLDKPDGVQQYVLRLGEWLSAQGHEVHYLVGETRRQDLPNVHSLSRNVRLHFNGSNQFIPLPAAKHRLQAVLSKHPFDILHVQVPYSPFMAQRLLRLAPTDTAIIGTFHIAPKSWWVTAGNYLLGMWLRPSLHHFDKMLSVSNAASDFAYSTFRVQSEILPNVVDFKRFHSAQAFPKYVDNTPTIIFLGRLVPRKGSLLLLEAIKALREQHPGLKFRVLICGSGPLQAKLEAYLRQHQLEGVVEMVGFVSEADKPRYFASADIAVFPSSGGESFGIVLLEAMASGKASALAGDNTGYRSVLSAQPQLLFDPKNSQALADKLAYYLQDETQRRAAAAWGEQFARQFDTAVVGARLLDYYKEALRAKRQQ